MVQVRRGGAACRSRSRLRKLRNGALGGQRRSPAFARSPTATRTTRSVSAPARAGTTRSHQPLCRNACGQACEEHDEREAAAGALLISTGRRCSSWTENRFTSGRQCSRRHGLFVRRSATALTPGTRLLVVGASGDPFVSTWHASHFRDLSRPERSGHRNPRRLRVKSLGDLDLCRPERPRRVQQPSGRAGEVDVLGLDRSRPSAPARLVRPSTVRVRDHLVRAAALPSRLVLRRVGVADLRRVVPPGEGAVERRADARIGLRADDEQSPDSRPDSTVSSAVSRTSRRSSLDEAARRRPSQLGHRSASRRSPRQLLVDCLTR